MGTNVSNFQNNAKNSNIILTSESNEMEFSKEVKTVSSFKNSDFGELKIIIIDEEPYFIGSPIASFLGYTNPRKAIRDHVDEDDRLIMKVPDTRGWNETFRPYTPNTKILIINESGLYSLIFGSKMDFAKKFKKWVTSEVLPSIRKTGSYSITPKDYPSALRALADEIDAKNRAIAERAQAEAERQQAIKTIEEQRPDVEFAESFKKVDHENMWRRSLSRMESSSQKRIFVCFLRKSSSCSEMGRVDGSCTVILSKISLVFTDHILLTNIPGKELISKPST